MNRVQKRKEIYALMLSGQWEELRERYHFKPRFRESKTDGGTIRRVIDWTSLSGEIYLILKCGGKIRDTPFTLEGGIFDQKEGGRIRIRRLKPEYIPAERRVVRHTLVERTPVRDRLYERQSGICYYCKRYVAPGSRDWTIEHLTPICRAGTNADDNLVGACETCNSNKGDMIHEEFLASEFFKRIASPPKNG